MGGTGKMTTTHLTHAVDACSTFTPGIGYKTALCGQVGVFVSFCFETVTCAACLVAGYKKDFTK